MRPWRFGNGVILIGSLLIEESCLFKKSPPKASIVIPPAPQAKPPEPLPVPPPIASSTDTTPAKVDQIPTLPPPTQQPAAPKQRPPRRPGQTGTTAGDAQTPAQPAADNQTHAPSTNPATGPSLQPMLGQREIAERNRRIGQYLEKARLIVLRAERANPDSETRDLIAQVRTFLQQAEEARKVDLVRAENLAERAEVLSRGLVR